MYVGYTEELAGQFLIVLLSAYFALFGKRTSTRGKRARFCYRPQQQQQHFRSLAAERLLCSVIFLDENPCVR